MHLTMHKYSIEVLVAIQMKPCITAKTKLSICLLQFRDYPYCANFMNAVLETNSCIGTSLTQNVLQAPHDSFA